ncbi:MAG: hypothetical protein RBR69_03880, partial [Candidatus Cloacimonadaceae bacterium]|nr:hypothetical protein [Candidatus Cloacimonadaceae bacterium]
MKASNKQASLQHWMRLASSKTGSLETRAVSVFSRRAYWIGCVSRPARLEVLKQEQFPCSAG